MKKLGLIIIITLLCNLIKAQIVISSIDDPTPTNSSVILEFDNNENKGIILPQVSFIGFAKGGTFIANKDEFSVQYFIDSKSINLTESGNYVPHSFYDNKNEDIGTGIIIGDLNTNLFGPLILNSNNKALVLPKVSNPHDQITNPIAGTIVYDSTSDSLAVFDGSYWYFWN